MQAAAVELPDAVFLVSPLPSRFAEWIITERGYRLMPLPFGNAMSLRDNSLQDVVIPAYTYSVVPAVPAEPVHTIAPSLSIIAHRDVPDTAAASRLELRLTQLKSEALEQFSAGKLIRLILCGSYLSWLSTGGWSIMLPLVLEFSHAK